MTSHTSHLLPRSGENDITHKASAAPGQTGENDVTHKASAAPGQAGENDVTHKASAAPGQAGENDVHTRHLLPQIKLERMTSTQGICRASLSGGRVCLQTRGAAVQQSCVCCLSLGSTARPSQSHVHTDEQINCVVLCMTPVIGRQIPVISLLVVIIR